MFASKQLKKILVLAVLLSLALTFVSLRSQKTYIADGFISLYDGETKIGYGWPWNFYFVAQDGTRSISFSDFLWSTVFWFVISYPSIIIGASAYKKIS